MLREGKTKIEICDYMWLYGKIRQKTVYNYITEATAILTAERAETHAAAKKERQERELAALAKIPTPAEIILSLLSELNLEKPVPTGFELKIIGGEPKNIQRFASETHRQFVLKTLLAYTLEMDKAGEVQTTQPIITIDTTAEIIENEDDLTDQEDDE